MDRTERLYKIDAMLNRKPFVHVQEFLDELEVSLATFKRDLEYMRSRLHAPIEYDAASNGYHFATRSVGNKYALPGLWFNAEEVYALLTMQHLLRSLGPGLLTPHVEPLLSRLKLLLDNEGFSMESVEKRIKIFNPTARVSQSEHFQPIAMAVVKQQRLVIGHHNRQRNETLEREVSPARLTFYKGTWYLDGYCHVRQAVRSFGLDAIVSVRMTTDKAKAVSSKDIAKHLDAGYGIFAGDELEVAELEFAAEVAQWVSKEAWHPEQVGTNLENGRYLLRVPYSQPDELAMDVMRYLPHVTVNGPKSLKEYVRKRVTDGLQAL